MSIEIRHMSIKSHVIQRQAAGREEDDVEPPEAPLPPDWREQCRRLVLELLETRGER